MTYEDTLEAAQFAGLKPYVFSVDRPRKSSVFLSSQVCPLDMTRREFAFSNHPAANGNHAVSMTWRTVLGDNLQRLRTIRVFGPKDKVLALLPEEQEV